MGVLNYYNQSGVGENKQLSIVIVGGLFFTFLNVLSKG